MRRLARFFRVATLGILPFGLLAMSSVAQDTPVPGTALPDDCQNGRTPTVQESEQLQNQQKNDYLAWEGVCRRNPVGTPIPTRDLPQITGQDVLPPPLQQDLDEALKLNPKLEFQPFDVILTKDWATIPLVGPSVGDKQEPEFMVVLVREGTFVLDLGVVEDGFRPVYVTTPREAFVTMHPWDMSIATPHYMPDDVLRVNGEICTVSCPVQLGEPVELQPGDFAVAARGALCTYCLEHSAIDEDGVHGRIEVYPLMDPTAVPDGFSWVQSWGRININGEVGMRDEPTMLGWSLNLLNTGCKDH